MVPKPKMHARSFTSCIPAHIHIHAADFCELSRHLSAPWRAVAHSAGLMCMFRAPLSRFQAVHNQNQYTISSFANSSLYTALTRIVDGCKAFSLSPWVELWPASSEGRKSMKMQPLRLLLCSLLLHLCKVCSTGEALGFRVANDAPIRGEFEVLRQQPGIGLAVQRHVRVCSSSLRLDGMRNLA